MASFGLGGGNSNAAPQSPAITDNIDASTPFLAASEGNLQLLQTSLQHLQQQPCTIQDDNGYTLFMAAASYNHINILKYLLQNTPQDQTFLYAQDEEGDNVLHYAGNVETAKFLLQLPNAQSLLASKNKQDQTPLQAKQEELNEMMQDEDVEEQDEDVETLQTLVEFLTQASAATR